MIIEIDEERADKLRVFAAETGRGIAGVVEELVDRAFEHDSEALGSIAPEEQLAKTSRLLEEMEQLPASSINENFSGSEHDQVLYPTHGDIP